MSIKNGLFSSESVSEGHPDKLADRISDRILDAFLERDPDARVACETMLADQCVIIAGEFKTRRIEDFKRSAKPLSRWYARCFRMLDMAIVRLELIPIVARSRFASMVNPRT